MTSNKTGDSKVPPDTRPVSEAYHALSDDEFKALQSEAEAANVARAAREDGNRRHVFGKKPRDLKRDDEELEKKASADILQIAFALANEELDSKESCQRIAIQHAMSDPTSSSLASLITNAQKCGKT